MSQSWIKLHNFLISFTFLISTRIRNESSIEVRGCRRVSHSLSLFLALSFLKLIFMSHAAFNLESQAYLLIRLCRFKREPREKNPVSWCCNSLWIRSILTMKSFTFLVTVMLMGVVVTARSVSDNSADSPSEFNPFLPSSLLCASLCVINEILRWLNLIMCVRKKIKGKKNL
jgi:hypothetical protein